MSVFFTFARSEFSGLITQIRIINARRKNVSGHSAGHEIRCFGQGIFCIALFDTG